MSSNGNEPTIPPDVPWSDDNPPVLYVCSNHVFHMPGCDGNCGELLVTEQKVKLINEGLAYARAGMNWRGVPAAYENTIPVPGIRVELVDVLIWLEVMKDMVCELYGISAEHFDDEFARRKYEMLHEIREINERTIRQQRTADSLGIIKNPIFGPDGKPLT